MQASRYVKSAGVGQFWPDLGGCLPPVSPVGNALPGLSRQKACRCRFSPPLETMRDFPCGPWHQGAAVGISCPTRAKPLQCVWPRRCSLRSPSDNAPTVRANGLRCRRYRTCFGGVGNISLQFVCSLPQSEPRTMAATPVRAISDRPRGRINSAKASIFSGVPVSSKTKLSSVESTTRARKISAVLRASTRVSPVPLTLNRASSRLTAGPLDGQVMHVMDRHHAAKLVLDLLDHLGRAGGDDGDARAMAFVVDLSHGQAVDIVAPAGKTGR